ncbi:cytochrome P450 [Aaosphaeria arxii CBS 175.79]|uniref:Bifunctional cytochrome P450/NADPH--P450 reductase n=1 Tax=Aaosphaeria arxii CBS 175.79 TaxID=1450172 RepID=A0A6A5Y0U8_9PLEO|nr:cytochrome P450 [Aaosphaeria arxii CBS 175.79]KAF2019092.1 cytochrome P450 [Aaosphaeria arxii CBS 175.79]
MANSKQELEPIPGPPGLPFVGNISDIDPQNPIKSMMNLTDIYGPIWTLSIGSKSRIIIASQSLMNEVCDEERFEKGVSVALQEVRNGTHDGLFTSFGPEEKNWGIAHRVLMPAFGPLSIRSMFDEMHDIASQLVMKWARHGPNHVIQVTDDFTRLTLDTIALCAMDYRFNSYYSESIHPFVEAMSDFLKTSGDRARRGAFAQSLFYREESRKYWADIELLRKTSMDVIQSRKANPTDKKDLLNAMLNGVDPKTGEKMSEESVMDNMITFLIAGHETTSGMLSFAFYYLLKNPEAYEKAQKEVDEVIGKDPITVEHTSKLPYLNAVLRETLRLSPTAPAIGLKPKNDEILCGKYAVPKGTPIQALFHKIHRDPAVYGEDAEEFRPERMLDEEFERRNKEFPNCWKPFGNGMRACIGRPFAWLEALLVTAILLQNFNFTMDDPSYILQIKQTLTIKPKGFLMRAHLRNHMSATTLERVLATTSLDKAPTKTGKVVSTSTGAKGKPLIILYGSNTGTCEALANRLAGDAAKHGFSAEVVDTLDSRKDNLPNNKPIVIVTASYEGQPAENAAHFVNWVGNLKGSELQGVCYSVFGCGHRDWSKTYQRIPKYLDSALEKRGASRIAPIGAADAAAGDIFTDFEAWEDQVFWPAMRERYGASEASGETYESKLDVEVSTPRSSNLRQDVREARVEEVSVLSAPGIPEKRHIEISLPSEITYSAGDYLAILPLNPKESVARAMRYFGLPWDSMLTLSSGGPTTLPVGHPTAATDVFGAYIELAQPASKRNILALIDATSDDKEKKELTRLSDTDFTTEITEKRVSVLDLLERFRTITLPIGAFLQMQPPMRVRQYSISSSPLWNPSNVTLTYSVVDQPALSGQGRFVGVASSYLSSLAVGDKLHVSVRPSHQSFHLPKDSKNVPIIMVAAGTGLAPFRGFIQERAAQMAAGRPLAPALLFYGCHSPDTDALYSDLLARWEALGAVSVRYAYSRASDLSEGCKYVQDRMYHDRADVVELFNAGGKVFICGNRNVGEGVSKICIKIAKEKREEVRGEEVTEEHVKEWFDGLRNERFATDVFA